MAEQNRKHCPEASVSSRRSHLFLQTAGSTDVMLSSLMGVKRRQEKEAVVQAR